MDKEFDVEQAYAAMTEITNELHLLFKDEKDFDYIYLILLFILQMKMQRKLTKEESYEMFCKVFDIIENNEKLKKLFD